MENGSQNTKHLKINRNVNEKKKIACCTISVGSVSNDLMVCLK